MSVAVRHVVVVLVAVLALGGCAGEETGSGGSSAATSFTLPPTTSSTLPPTTAATVVPTTLPPASGTRLECITRAVFDRVPSEQIDARCELEALIDGIVARTNVRDAIARDLVAVSPGWGGLDPAGYVGEWVRHACSVGPAAVPALVDQLQPDPVERLTLLAPLTDFAALVADGCERGDAVAIRNGLSGAAWSVVLGSAPTSEQITRSFTASSTALVAQSLLERARNPCDVVGNAAVLLVERLAGGDVPTWADLAFGTAVGAGCQHLLS